MTAQPTEKSIEIAYNRIHSIANKVKKYMAGTPNLFVMLNDIEDALSTERCKRQEAEAKTSAEIHVDKSAMKEIFGTTINELKAALQAERENSARLVEALRLNIDGEQCQFDHHGYCQTHRIRADGPCENKVGHEALTRHEELRSHGPA